MSIKLVTVLILCIWVLDGSVNSMRFEDYDYFYPYKYINSMRYRINMVSSKPVKSYSKLKLILVNLDGLVESDLANASIPNINKHFVQNGAKASLTLGQDVDEVSAPVWLENQLTKKGKSAILGSLPGGNMKRANETVAYLRDTRDSLNWFEKVDDLIGLISNEKNKKLNLAVLHFGELRAVKQKYGCESTQMVKMLIDDFDRLVNYLVVRLTDLGLFNNVNIILTSNFGAKTQETAPQRKVNLKKFALKMKNHFIQLNTGNNTQRNSSSIKRKSEVLKKMSLKSLKNNVRILSVPQTNSTEQKGQSKCINIEAENVGVFLARGPAFRKTNSANVTIDIKDVQQITRQVLGIECNSTQCESTLEKLNDIIKVKKTWDQQIQQIVDLIVNSTVQLAKNITDNSEPITTTTNSTTIPTTVSTSTVSSNVLPLVMDMQRYISGNLTVELKKFYKFVDQHYDNVKFVNFMHLFVLFVILCAFIIIIHFNTKKISSSANFKYGPLAN